MFLQVHLIICYFKKIVLVSHTYTLKEYSKWMYSKYLSIVLTFVLNAVSLTLDFKYIIVCTFICIVWWPRELNALRLQKTHANRKSTSKSRKSFHQFDSRWRKRSQHKQVKKHTANAHNTTKYIWFAARFFFGCVVSICSMCVSNLWSCFLNLQVFFFYLQRVELSRPP